MIYYKLKNALLMNFIQNKEVFAADLEKEVCIFNPENGEYINLNKTATEIWHFIEEIKSFDSIIDLFDKKYSGEKELIKKNVKEFLDEGANKGVIKMFN